MILRSIMLLLLSRFSLVRLCATPETAARWAPLSLGFSRQEHWSGLPFPSPMHESEKCKWSRSVVSDSSRPHGLQPTRLLRPWDFPGESTGVGAIAFSEYYASVTRWMKHCQVCACIRYLLNDCNRSLAGKRLNNGVRPFSLFCCISLLVLPDSSTLHSSQHYSVCVCVCVCVC